MMPYPKPPVNSHALITLLAYALSHPHSAAYRTPDPPAGQGGAPWALNSQAAKPQRDSE